MQQKIPGYVEHGKVVLQSWQRCKDLGLTHQSKPVVEHLNSGALSSLIEQHQHILETTHYEVLPYYENLLVNSKSQVMLADHQGYLLASWGDKRVKQHHEEIY